MAKVNPIEEEKTLLMIFFISNFTITVKQLNNVVVRNNHVLSLGGN
jgi:hypothetical protein